MLKHSFIWKLCAVAGIVLITLKIWAVPELSLFVITIPFLVYLTLAAWGSIFVQSGYYMPVVWKGSPHKKSIAITFDDGPSGEHTESILQILDQYKIKAVFFCIGKNVENRPEQVKKIHEAGHIIGNHSYSHHVLFDLFPGKKVLKDLSMANKAIQTVTGKRPLLFRPPFGVTNPMIASAVKKLDLTTVGWSLRSLDTTFSDEKKLFKKVSSQINPGDIILFHDRCRVTVQILPSVIEYLLAQGFVIEPLDQILKIKAYE